VLSQGIGTPSILNSGISEGKMKVTGFSDSGSIAAGAIAEIWSVSNQQVFFPSIHVAGARLPLLTKASNIINTAGCSIFNDTGLSKNYVVQGYYTQA
jgi:hypothetical protein